jgi:hypothetical protein
MATCAPADTPIIQELLAVDGLSAGRGRSASPTWLYSPRRFPCPFHARTPLKLSNYFIQKGLAFRAERSGTGANHGRQVRQRSCPAGLVAEVGRRWCGQAAAEPNGGISNVKAREETIDRTGGACARCKAFGPSRGRTEV